VQEAEFVAFRVGQDVPALGSGLADIGGAWRRERAAAPPRRDTLSAFALPAGETTVHLDRGYDSLITRAELDRRGMAACISKRGTPAPIQATTRCVVERTKA
jgi:hypothetical protein